MVPVLLRQRFSSSHPAVGTADAEINIHPAEKTELSKIPSFKPAGSTVGQNIALPVLSAGENYVLF